MRKEVAIVNCKAWTPEGIVDAVGIREGRVVSIGEEREVISDLEDPKIVNLGGLWLLPGLHDCHIHLPSYGIRRLLWTDLRGCKTVSEVISRLSRRKKENVIIGYGFGELDRLPTRSDLDRVSKEKPVVAVRVCGHLSVLNSKAMEITGLYSEKGIVRLDVSRVTSRLPPPSREDLRRAYEYVFSNLIEKGIVAVNYMANTSLFPRDLEVLSEIKPPVRIRVYVPFSNEVPKSNGPFEIKGVKVILDGSLGARTAFLKEEYSDDPGNKGTLYLGEDELREIRKSYDGQMAVHAIGDGAIEIAVEVLRGRDRIEHFSLPSEDSIELASKKKIIASIQPQFVSSDYWIPKRLGARGKMAYPFKKMLDAGIIMCSGSDAPIEEIDPMRGIEILMEKGLTFEEALRTYTLNGAYATFEERERGEIEVGKLADMTISKSPLGRTIGTVVGGEFHIKGGVLPHSESPLRLL